jgi:hypothetical protein
MPRKKLTLETFFTEKRRDAFIEIPEFDGSVFVKLGKLAVNGKLHPFLMVGQISRRSRIDNFQSSPNPKRTGQFRPMLDHIEAIANKFGYDLCLYSVINEFLPRVCFRYGFIEQAPGTFIRMRQWRKTQESAPRTEATAPEEGPDAEEEPHASAPRY